ncbi:MAG: sulfatase [Planctomycetota bacterium]|nr:sulfatase [Planctomycetota bacterium]
MPALTRRHFLHLAAWGTAAAWAPALLPCRTARAAKPKRMNVLFIAVDDLKPLLGCFGYAKIHSPNIDRLASRGTVFARTYCQQAVCAPSRASVMSGCRPDTTRVWDLQTPLRRAMPNVLTLCQHFKAHGYTTVSLGKVYHHYVKDDPQGWSEVPWRPSGDWKGRGYLSPEAQAIAAKEAKGRGPAYESADVPDTAYPDGALATKAVETLRRVKGKPFFLAVGFYKPHLPFNAPKRYWDMYPPKMIDLADNPFKPNGAPDLAMTNWGELRNYPGMPKRGDLTQDQARTLIRGYKACVSYTDAQIGCVLDELARLGLAEKTVVVLWGDHGWHLGDHGLWCKHTNFESATRAPLVLASPRIAGGKRTQRLAEFVDIYPSTCALAGLSVPEHCEGTSLVPLMRAPEQPWKAAAFSQYPRGRGVMGYSMRTERYRFTRWQKRQGGEVVATELYDHENDPEENVNLAARPEHKDLVARLARQLEAGWQAARPG